MNKQPFALKPQQPLLPSFQQTNHNPGLKKYLLKMRAELLNHLILPMIWAKPGLKVFHIPDIDFRSDHLLFKDCLLDLKGWSDAHPGHVPVVITMNAKDGNERGLHPLLPFIKKALDSIDLEIRSVFKPNDLITPDLVRGNFPDLESAVFQCLVYNYYGCRLFEGD